MCVCGVCLAASDDVSAVCRVRSFAIDGTAVTAVSTEHRERAKRERSAVLLLVVEVCDWSDFEDTGERSVGRAGPCSQEIASFFVAVAVFFAEWIHEGKLLLIRYNVSRCVTCWLLHTAASANKVKPTSLLDRLLFCYIIMKMIQF